MPTIEQLPVGTVIEFLGFDDWKRYADAMGYWAFEPAQTPGCCRMRRDLGVLANISVPAKFTFRIVGAPQTTL